MVGVTNFEDILWGSVSTFSLQRIAERLMSSTALLQNLVSQIFYGSLFNFLGISGLNNLDIISSDATQMWY